MDSPKTVEVNLTGPEFARLANNFYNSLGLDSHQQRINIDSQLFNYFFQNHQSVKEKKKIAFVWICLNPPYWEFAKPMIEGAKNFFLPGHDVDYFLWSDMPSTALEVEKAIVEHFQKSNVPLTDLEGVKRLSNDIEAIHKMEKVAVFPTEAIEWPMPTLMRYHTFLQQEEILSKYDYIFYCDVDMAFVDVVGDEILGPTLTTGCNPMYWLDKTMWQPFESNPLSTAYIPRPGQIIDDGGKPHFMPQYYAGGMQGGKSNKFIEAMKVMRKNIDQDFANNYISRWNDEGHWNRYLFDHPEGVIALNPSYIYPDSLIKEYYQPRWNRSYQPKLITLTKKFSLKQLSAEEQQGIFAMQPK